jgi:ATP-dependent DNA helicase RecG
MAILIHEISLAERTKLLAQHEGHFCDFKSIAISPSKLTKTISAFANSEGGEVYVGVDEDKATGGKSWAGFPNPEAANAHLQVFEKLFPLGHGYGYTFIKSADSLGYVLKVDIIKSPDIKNASDGNAYIRRGAQNLPVQNDDEKRRLQHNKGIVSFESEPVNADLEIITNSTVILAFMLEVVPAAEPEQWLRKQQVIKNDKPTVAGLLLFSEEPQAILPKRSGIKLYRYQTSAKEGTRESLERDPESIEGDAYALIRAAVARTTEIIESVRINTPEGLESVKYPETAIHEIITNAVLHRDYSIADDIHIRIFDNRVEVVSHGTLPAHITPENILDERFARNAIIVRLINKFPNPPNKDVGEGLNTAFDAMREMKLKPPIISQDGGYVQVILKHEPLATPEEIILQYLSTSDNITNRVARDLCHIGSENKMKGILQRMVKRGMIELVPGTTRYSAAYQLTTSGHGTGYIESS